MARISIFITEVHNELKKVTWLKRDEVIQLLGLVMVISAIVSGYVGGVDFGLTKLLESLLIK